MIATAIFDTEAASYDAFCTTPLGQYVDRTERELLLALLQPGPGEHLIDLGCGTGAYAVALAELGCVVTGVDLSRGMLERARAKARPGLDTRFLEADLARLPLPDASFDAALLQVTLEFVAEPAAVFLEAMRILRPGGRLVVGLIHGPGPWARSYREKALQHPDSVYRHAHFWTRPELETVAGMAPTAVRLGLFVGPEEFTDLTQAEKLEHGRAHRPGEEAGFLAARFERPPLPTSGA